MRKIIIFFGISGIIAFIVFNVYQAQKTRKLSSILLDINANLESQINQRSELRKYYFSLRDNPNIANELTISFLESEFFSSQIKNLDTQIASVDFNKQNYLEINKKREHLKTLKFGLRKTINNEDYTVNDIYQWSVKLVSALDDLYNHELLYSNKISSYQTNKNTINFKISTAIIVFVSLMFILAYLSKRKMLIILNHKNEEEIKIKNAKLLHSEKVLLSLMEDANREKEDAMDLFRQNTLLIAIVKQSKNPIFRVNLDGVIIESNSAAKSILNFSYSDNKPTYILDVFTGYEKNLFLKFFEESQISDSALIFEASQVSTRSGEQRIFEITLLGLRDQNKDVCESAISFQDITERKRNEALFPLIVEASPSAMIIVSQGGDIDFVNSQAEKLFGYSKEELLGQKIEILIPQRFAHNHAKLRDDFFENPVSRPVGERKDLFGIRKNGNELPLEIGLSLIETSSGIKVLSSIIDLTERKRYISELMRINEELEKFAYIASHDLKAPLRAVDQLATWIQEDLEGKLDKDTSNHLRLMRSRIDRMENLLADLLEYSRSGRIKGTIETVDIAKLIQDVFDLNCIDKGFKLKLLGDFSIIETHKTPLELVFRNLIGNALKHHDKETGVITISLMRKDSSLIFSIADDGPGIDIEHRERVFDMFQTLRPRDEVEGSGMGLAIVRKTIESFGGLITLTPNTPRGSIFSFSWPEQINKDKNEGGNIFN